MLDEQQLSPGRNTRPREKSPPMRSNAGFAEWPSLAASVYARRIRAMGRFGPLSAILALAQQF
ncbi:hypothetical protein Q2941_50890 [Bradyrhizobium sp. UFLA05-153]